MMMGLFASFSVFENKSTRILLLQISLLIVEYCMENNDLCHLNRASESLGYYIWTARTPSVELCVRHSNPCRM